MHEIFDDGGIIAVNDEFIRGVGSADLGNDGILSTRGAGKSRIIRHEFVGLTDDNLQHKDGINETTTVIVGL